MIPRIAIKKETRLVGMSERMSFVNNLTETLWRRFMHSRRLIKNPAANEFYSLQLYPPGFFEEFDPTAGFTKWAAIEVPAFDEIPPGMGPFILSPGLYAVFTYKGAARDASEIFKSILGTWLPSSEYTLDDRPHFELLGEKFDKESAHSEEEIWIPIKPKA